MNVVCFSSLLLLLSNNSTKATVTGGLFAFKAPLPGRVFRTDWNDEQSLFLQVINKHSLSLSWSVM